MSITDRYPQCVDLAGCKNLRIAVALRRKAGDGTPHVTFVFTGKGATDVLVKSTGREELLDVREWGECTGLPEDTEWPDGFAERVTFHLYRVPKSFPEVLDGTLSVLISVSSGHFTMTHDNVDVLCNPHTHDLKITYPGAPESFNIRSWPGGRFNNTMPSQRCVESHMYPSLFWESKNTFSMHLICDGEE